MKKLIRTTQFRRNYNQRIRGKLPLEINFEETMELFSKDPSNIVLRDHALQGSMIGLRSLSINSSYRIVYRPTSKGIVLLDIGMHAEVYKN